MVERCERCLSLSSIRSFTEDPSLPPGEPPLPLPLLLLPPSSLASLVVWLKRRKCWTGFQRWLMIWFKYYRLTFIAQTRMSPPRVQVRRPRGILDGRRACMCDMRSRGSFTINILHTEITNLAALSPTSHSGPYSPVGWAVPMRPPSDLNFPPFPEFGRISLDVPAAEASAAASTRALLLLLRLMGSARPNILKNA